MRGNDAPARVTILANALCPHCVHATDTLTDWCCEEGITVAGIDLMAHPEVIERWKIESSPAVVVEDATGERVFSGFPTHAEFVALTH